MADQEGGIVEAPTENGASTLRVAGLIAFHKKRKQNSYDQLLQAAAKLFCNQGYAAVLIDDIVADAGVSRMTFYRHFASKGALAAALFKHVSADAIPRYLSIGKQQYRDRAVVVSWIRNLFKADRENRGIIRVFNQAVIDENDFNSSAQELIPNVILLLGADIPAFAVKPDRSDHREQWLKAWLLLYEILGLSGHAAVQEGVATDPMIIKILADKFLAFVVDAKPSDALQGGNHT